MRYTGPKCRLCRREGEKLFLKGDRCHSQKCAFTRHSDVPGKYGKEQRGKKTEYGMQLRSKQRAKRLYGLSEQQFRAYYDEATRREGNTGDNFQRLLETRLDNVIFRAGFAVSRSQARQIVGHNLFRKNGLRASIPSMQVKIGDKFEVASSSKTSALFEDLKKKKVTAPAWLKVDFAKLSVEVIGQPELTDCERIDAQTIVEFYSR